MEHMEPGIPHTEKQSQLSEEKLGVGGAGDTGHYRESPEESAPREACLTQRL